MSSILCSLFERRAEAAPVAFVERFVLPLRPRLFIRYLRLKTYVCRLKTYVQTHGTVKSTVRIAELLRAATPVEEPGTISAPAMLLPLPHRY